MIGLSPTSIEIQTKEPLGERAIYMSPKEELFQSWEILDIKGMREMSFYVWRFLKAEKENIFSSV